MQALINALKGAQSILLTTHINPDGDAVGSVISLGLALRALDKSVTILLAGGLPRSFYYLSPEPIRIVSEYPSSTLFDLAVILDAPDLERTGFKPALSALVNLNRLAIVDHHPWGDLERLAQYKLHNVQACATAELCYHLILALEVRLTPQISTAILTGIYTDTGAFQHANTTPKTLEIAAELMRRGARLNIITSAIAGIKTVAGLKLMGLAMKRLRESWDGQVAVTALTWADFTALGANTDDFTGISGQVKSLTEPKLSLIVAETAAGVLRGSLRINTGKSPKDINLSKLASLLGGGGHPRAAGFNLLGSLELPEGGQWKVNLKPGKIGG